MLFPEEDAPLLKSWIVKRIEDTSDADAEVLAEYIIALLKHDGTKDDVRRLCEAEIPDFLTEDPKAFLDDVFQAIAYKSYVPGAPPPPKLPPTGLPAQEAAAAFPQDAADAGPMPPQGPRKRGYHDFDAPGGQEGYNNGQRPMKNSRRHGRGRGGLEDGMPMGMAPPFDLESQMAALTSMGIFHPGIPQQFPGAGGRGGRQRKRGRCRDFDTKGFCARGSSCNFDHGNLNDGSAGYMPQMGRPDEEYDPDDAIITLTSPYTQAPPLGFGGRDANRGRGNRRGGRANKKRGARASFSAEGPVHDRSKSTIVIENIPEEHFSEDEVRTFFSQFGNITEISMQPYKHLAIVKYDKWGSANAAYRSPKVIFDNRFVKVFWYRDEKDSLPPSVANGSAFNGQAGSEQMDVEPEMDPEEFQRRQEEAQKQHQERESKRTELERQRLELEKKQQELMARHREETQRLQSKLAEKNAGDAENNAGGTGTDMLRAQLAALEQEAKILGIDPDAASEAASYSSRGGWRGRGGGGFRSRARAGRRGGRGSFRGGVEGRHAAYAQYSLDNRPKRLAITGVDFSVPEKDESLRHFLLMNLGEFESVDRSGLTTYVSFRDRKTAEKLYYTLHGKELPGVEGKLDLEWVNVSPASATTVSSTVPAQGEGDAMYTDADDAERQDAPLETEYDEQRMENEDAY